MRTRRSAQRLTFGEMQWGRSESLSPVKKQPLPTPMRIVLRPAVAGDSEGLAELIYMGAQSHCQTSGYALSLGGSRESQIKQIERLTRTKAQSWFYFCHFEVAETDGRVVASAAGFERIPTDAAVDIALREIGFSEAEVKALNRRIGEVYACFPVEPAGYWTIEHVAVLPAFRKKGLARAVTLRAMERGRALGFRHCPLDVFRGNVAVCALYESLGFRVTETFGEQVLPRRLDREGIERMTMVL